MSENQPRFEISSQHNSRKFGRSGGGSGSSRAIFGGKGGGGGVGIGAGSSTPHPPAVSSSPSSPAAVSQLKSASSRKSGYGRGNLGGYRNSESVGAAGRSSGLVYQPVQNAAHGHGQSSSSGNAKPVEAPTPKNVAHPLPKASSSQPTVKTSNSAASSVPPKAESGTFAVQFGTISPVVMNIKVPARTASAPPNLDEQKRDQALHGPPRPLHAVPISTVPKQQQEQENKKAFGPASQTKTGESNPPVQVKRDVHVPFPSGPPMAPSNPNVLPVTGIPPIPIPMGMPMPFPRPQMQIQLQFGAPNLQIQPQAVVANPLQMPMGLSPATAPQLPQPMFVPGHLFQQQAMMHQGQGLGYIPPLGHQLNPQVQARNIGMGIRLQVPPQQPNKFNAPTPRKAPVKITHPDTREELRLEKKTDFKDHISSVQRSTSAASSQFQAASHVPAYQMNYYYHMQPNYNQSQLTQIPKASQAGRPLVPALPNNGGRPGPISHGGSEGVHLENLPLSVPLSEPVQVTAKSHVPLLEEKVGTLPRITKEELPKVKPGKGVTTSHQSQTAVSSYSPEQMPKRDSELLKESTTDRCNHLTDVPSVASSRKAIPGASSSDTPMPTGNSGVSLVGHEYNKRVVAKDMQFSKDNQEKAIRKDSIYLDQRPQADVPNFSESMKVSLPEITGDAYTRDSTGDKLSIDIDHEHSLSARDSATSSEVSSLSNVQQNFTLASGLTKGDRDTGLHASLSLSRELQDSRETQDAIGVSSNALGLATDDVSGGEIIPSVPQSTIKKGLDPNLGQNDACVVHMVPEEKISFASYLTNKIYQYSTDDGHPVHCQEEFSKIDGPSFLLKKDSDNLESTEETQSYVHRVESEKFCASKEEANYTQVEDRIAEPDGVRFTKFDLTDAETSSACVDGKQPIPMDNPSIKPELTQNKLTDSTKSDAHAPEPTVALMIQKEDFVAELPRGRIHAINSGFKAKSSLETPKPKTPSRKNKKIKEILSKADAVGTSDLYNAYKVRQEKNEDFSSEAVDNFASSNENVSYDDSRKDISASDEDGQDKNDVDDWEDATDVSTHNPEMESRQAVNVMKQTNEDNFEANSQKKYSRDFLLSLSQQFIVLPAGFQIGSDVADVLMILPDCNPYITDRESYPSSGRIMARSPGTSRADRRGMGNMDDGKWAKLLGPTGAGGSLRPGIGVNLRGSGILSGPLSQGGPSRPGPDMDRWQRGNQIGFVTSPRLPMQVMHKAENKYEVGKVSDEEQAKQRQLKAILNKLTPQNFEKLFAKVADLNIDNAGTLTGVISQIFDKALMEPTFCEMNADFCYRLAGVLPAFNEDNESITFKRLLLNKCQEEFERGEREQEEAGKTEEEGGIKQSEDEREEKRLRARRRMLGNIRLIGELYKKKMLIERIMHECIQKLLGQYDNPDEENLEALCKLMSTIGQMIDHQRAKVHMDAYFEVMTKLSTNEKLSTRVRFMLRDVIDLRKNKWQERRKVEGPKKIEDVHRDAAQERQVQSSRLTRGGSMQRKGPAVDYGTRSSGPLISPGTQPVGSFRGLASQDVRSEERLLLERRTLPLPVCQKSADDTFAFGPQGGLGKSLSLRGQPSVSNFSPAVKDDRKMLSNQNGHSSLRNWETDHPRGESSTKSQAHRYSESVLGESSQQHAAYPQNAESKTFGHTRDVSATISDSSQTSAFEMEDVVLLQKKSLAALKEFYRIKDKKEVALCISELNAPNFYPLMISFWIIDSFERKDLERNLLANLLVALSNPQNSLFSQAQLMQGFENVLSLLEDAVNDAPRAAEFLGRIFATIILEDIAPLEDIGKLIYDGGEEPGRLREIGLAAEVLGSILDFIKLEKGISVLHHVRASSNLALGDFLPPHRIKSKLDAFL